MNTMESSIRLSAKSEFLTKSPTVFTFTMFYFDWNSSDGVAEESNEHRTNYSKYKYVWYSPNISKDSRKYTHHICVVYSKMITKINVFNPMFVSSHLYLESPEGTQVIVGSKT